MKFIIHADKPYPGYVESILCDNGTVGYTGGLTLEQYEAREGCKMRVIDEDELDRLTQLHLDMMTTDPAPISVEDWDEALNVLPPCRWHDVAGFSVFHISERITHDLVGWYAKRGDKAWQFNDRASITDAEIAAKLRGAS